MSLSILKKTNITIINYLQLAYFAESDYPDYHHCDESTEK